MQHPIFSNYYEAFFTGLFIFCDLAVLMALAFYSLLKEQKSTRSVAAGDDVDALRAVFARLSQHNSAYLLPEWIRLARDRGNDSMVEAIMDCARSTFALEKPYTDIGYRFSRPKGRLEIFASSFLWAILLQWGWLLGLALQGPIPSTGLRFLVQILVIGGPAAGVGVLLIKRLSQARYTLSRDGIECRPLFRNSFFIPWQAVSSVKLIGYREYELAWNAQTTRIRNMFDDNAYLPHLILAHLNENAALDQHFAFRRECWFPPAHSSSGDTAPP